MTISSSYTFTSTGQDIIRMALQLVGVLEAGTQPDAGQMALGMDFLNIGIKDLQNDGIELEVTERVTTALVTGTQSYVLAADTLDVDTRGAYVTGNGVNLPMIPMARAQFMELSLPMIQSQPTQFYVERGTSAQNVTVFLYPVPDGNWTTFTVCRIRLLRDVTTVGDTLDFPAKYMKTLAYMVGADFALHYGKGEKHGMLRGLLGSTKERAIDDDQEKGPIKFVPSYGISFRGRMFR